MKLSRRSFFASIIAALPVGDAIFAAPVSASKDVVFADAAKGLSRRADGTVGPPPSRLSVLCDGVEQRGVYEVSLSSGYALRYVMDADRPRLNVSMDVDRYCHVFAPGERWELKTKEQTR